jgi:hypothetical protein
MYTQGIHIVWESNSGNATISFRLSNRPRSTYLITRDQWHHVVFTRDVDFRIRQWVDGTLCYDEYPTDALDFSNYPIWIGGHEYEDGSGWSYCLCYLDEFRITKSIIYPASVSSFTPPTAPFSVTIPGSISIIDFSSTTNDNLINEIAVRQSNDQAFQINLNNEATIRSAEDQTLQTNINNEASIRFAETTIITEIITPAIRGTTLLLHFDGNHNDSAQNHIPTSSFSENYGIIDGISGFSQYGIFDIGFGLSFHFNDNNITNFGVDDFTIEFFVYSPTSYSPSSVNCIMEAGSGPSKITLRWEDEGTNARKILAHSSNENITITSNSLTPDTWHHVALTRNIDKKLRLWIDGVLSAESTTEDNVNYQGYYGAWIGSFIYQIGTPYCWLDDLRITKIALYTANFTPSSTPLIALPNIENTTTTYLNTLRVDKEASIRFANDQTLQANIDLKAPTASPVFTGFTTLGTGNIGICIKTLTGTTGLTEGASSSVPHGLTGDKIIAATGIVRTNTNDGYGPGNPSSEATFGISYDSTNISLDLSPTNSSSLLNKPFEIMIVYKE